VKKVVIRLGLTALIGLCGYLTVPTFVSARSEPSTASSKQFPIFSRFELPRNYGYFIGDEIPLTLVIETTGNIVLDLVNLPNKGYQHGLFEIRDRKMTFSTDAHGTKVYRIAYSLQYFGPTPWSEPFGPLEILYALPSDPNVSGQAHIYKRLLTQPIVIHLARIGPMQPTMVPQMKGLQDDQRSVAIWLSCTLGTAMVFTAIAGWGWQWYTNWQHRRTLSSQLPTAAAQALHRLRQEGTFFFHSPEESPPSVGARLDYIVRQYLHTQYGVPAFNLTPAELAVHLNGSLSNPAILSVLERCASLKYQAPAAIPMIERQLWKETTLLFETCQEEHAP
jgi:hypothetical protein